MYTRTYNDDIGEIIIPERYGGTSFGHTEEKKEDGMRQESNGKNPWENNDIHTPSAQNNEEAEEASATPISQPLTAIFSGLFKGDFLSLKKIGKEELIIIATATFLLFSKEGDKECAIMLILLLFLS